MIENANTAIVRRWFEEVWNQKRLDTIDELMAPDGVARDIGAPGTEIRGPAEFRAAAEKLHAFFGEMHFAVQDIFGVGDRVAVRVNARLRATGSFDGGPGSGEVFDSPIMVIVHMRDGQIVEGWNFWDVPGALKAVKAPLETTRLL
jgi:ketosteroid isomerase-like protein